MSYSLQQKSAGIRPLQKFKLMFRRESRITGLAASAYDNEKRKCYILVDKFEVGFISNPTHSYVFKDEDAWLVHIFTVTDDGGRLNVKLGRKFTSLDEAKQAVKTGMKCIPEAMFEFAPDGTRAVIAMDEASINRTFSV